MHDPFAEKPTPWWEYLWRGDRTAKWAPKRQAGIVAVLGGILIWAFPHTELGLIERSVLGAAIALLPGYLLEAWWKQRARRESERLFVLPDGSRDKP